MSHLGYLHGHRPGRRPVGRLRHLWQRLRPLGLEDISLRGPRPASPLRIVIGRDVSGSMEPYRAAREAALDALVVWAPDNLRPTDELGVLDFAETARWALRPTQIHRLADSPRQDTVLDGSWTLWTPVVDHVRGLGDHPGRVSLWLVSDGEYPDYPDSTDAGRRLLTDAGIASMPLLIPAKSVSVPAPWDELFPDQPVLTFDGTHGRSTALAFVAALAQVTGQRLVRTRTDTGTDQWAWDRMVPSTERIGS